MTNSKRARSAAAPLPAFVELDLVSEAPRLPPTFDSDDRIAEVLRLLEARGRHPVLVGPHDSGKSAIVRGIAHAMHQGARPVDARAIWRVSIRAIDLATHKDGTMIAALSQVIGDAAASRDRPLLWVPDVHLARMFDVHSVLSLLLERSGVRMIGEALPPFDQRCLDDVELANSLHPLRMPQCDDKRTRALLEAHRQWLAERGRVVRKSAIERSLSLSEGAFANRALPGRAFRVLSLALEASPPDEPLNGSRVDASLARTVDVPPAIADRDATALRSKIEQSVVGQREAVQTLVERYALWKANVTRADRPAAMVLFAGPPGAGKSWVSREFARAALGHDEHIVAVHGGELADDWKVDQLLGQVGAATPELRRGTLAHALLGSAVSVLVIDEIERAHPLLFRWLMQVADRGAYFTGSGEHVSMKSTFVLVTTNAGSDAFRDRPLGIGPEHDNSRRVQALRRSVETTLPPELFDRMDATVFCAPLTLDERVELARRWVQSALVAMSSADAPAPSIADLEAQLRAIAQRATDARSLRLCVERELLAPLALRPRSGS